MEAGNRRVRGGDGTTEVRLAGCNVRKALPALGGLEDGQAMSQGMWAAVGS